jgi:glycosyltransferase involved in cell wall biosynthesis
MTLMKNVDRADVVSAIREADVVVLTSSREASPLVILESMAAETPWVAFDVGATRDNDGGIVVSTAEDMAQQVTELLRSPERRQALGAAGVKQVSARHSWDRVAATHLELYRSVCVPAS